MHPMQMSADDSALLVIDVQDKLLMLIPGEAAMVRNIAFLIDAAKLLQMPVTATEQYPKGLGPTTAELAGAFHSGRRRRRLVVVLFRAWSRGFSVRRGPRCCWWGLRRMCVCRIRRSI